MTSSTLVHLVYIHGFQGNDTTFQSFPTDLQRYLSGKLPSYLTIRSSIYPTYKSVKPISFATRNFLEWLTTQPPGPVILLGHSMGGLLAADAATDPSNNRIIGMIAFDTPYLGMHPHVVVSGLASLFSKDEDKGKKTVAATLNDASQVKMIDDGVTDDWDAFKKGLALRNHSSHGSGTSSLSHSPASTHSSPAFLDRTVAFFSDHYNDPLVRWFRKHPDVSSSKRSVVEHFQFGICMFDPKGLKERYGRLVGWDGHWVNYWTETVPKPGEKGVNTHAQGDRKDDDKICADEREADNDAALLETGIALSSLTTDASDPPTPGVQERPQAKGKEKTKHPRHFIVLPTGLGRVLGGWDKWERVPIGGVGDEVEAHTGMFIRGKNREYEVLVDRVGKRVLEWCNRSQ